MKRGQSQFMSIGVIFSIIIIIFIFAISIYVVTKFINIGKCADIALFKDDLQEKINTAWSSEIVDDEFTGKLPNGIEAVCLGKENPVTATREYASLKDYTRYDGNLFFYPPESTCDQPYTTIEHIETGSFRCFPVVKNEVSFRIEKGSFDDIVKIG